MKHLIAIGIVFLAYSNIIFSQNIAYAKHIINTLCSSTMQGRGYVNNAHFKAANFIASEMKSIGLVNFDTSFFQPFPIDVNTFPSNFELKVNHTPLVTGADFLIAPNSPSIKGTFKVITINESTLLHPAKFNAILKNVKKFTNKVVFLRYSKQNADSLKAKIITLKNTLPAKAFIKIEDKKLTWHIDNEVAKYTDITILQSAMPKKINTITINVSNNFLQQINTQNVIGYIKGTVQPDSFFVFSAHYDHLGTMGNKAFTPGANDNASGIAMLLNLATYYAKNPPKYSIAFIAFGAEELGLVGSKFYTEHPLFSLTAIKFLINVDIVGTGNEGITVVNATELSSAFKVLKNINDTHQYLTKIKERGKAANSDHFYFFEKGVPAFFIYTMGGIQAYHDINDRAETLPLTAFNELCQLIIQFINTY